MSSFSRPGNPHDNAQAEAGWSTLKTELLAPRHCLCLPQDSPAGWQVAYYLDTYFNLDRRHSASVTAHRTTLNTT
ncbi:hypothetical protein [Hymenobacter sp.]|uniref:hypothetical protein n=1 Tax=Hymenobacter sp. TaxID=1898978 RepID=UPI00286D47D8|nr:hypothetical protein [Hymenobacter sp.]